MKAGQIGQALEGATFPSRAACKPTYRCQQGSYLPVFEPTHNLLDEDDFVCDGFVPLDLQQHVVVVLRKESTTTSEDVHLLEVVQVQGLAAWLWQSQAQTQAGQRMAGEQP